MIRGFRCASIGFLSFSVRRPLKDYNQRRMNEYILPHHLTGERQRLGLMAHLLDRSIAATLRSSAFNPDGTASKLAAALALYRNGWPAA
jgi:hypothetical protein